MLCWVTVYSKYSIIIRTKGWTCVSLVTCTQCCICLKTIHSKIIFKWKSLFLLFIRIFFITKRWITEVFRECSLKQCIKSFPGLKDSSILRCLACTVTTYRFSYCGYYHYSYCSLWALPEAKTKPQPRMQWVSDGKAWDTLCLKIEELILSHSSWFNERRIYGMAALKVPCWKLSKNNTKNLEISLYIHRSVALKKTYFYWSTLIFPFNEEDRHNEKGWMEC